MPVFTYAVGFTDEVSINSLTQLGGIALDLTWKIFFVFAVVSFVISGIIFLTSMGDPAKIKTARLAVIFGVVGIAVALLAYSIVGIVTNIFINK